MTGIWGMLLFFYAFFFTVLKYAGRDACQQTPEEEPTPEPPEEALTEPQGSSNADIFFFMSIAFAGLLGLILAV